MKTGTRSIRLLAFAAVIMLCLGSVASAEKFTGKVVSITDGDTIRVMHEGNAERVRIYGIDCPETDQPGGSQAKLATSQFVMGKTVTVDVNSEDRYGRSVGVVTYVLTDFGTCDLGHMLVADGMAWWYRDYAKNDSQLEDCEAEARNARLGIWKDTDQIPPWEWRKGTDHHTAKYAWHGKLPIARGELLMVYTTSGSRLCHLKDFKHITSQSPTMYVVDAIRLGYTKCKECWK